MKHFMLPLALLLLLAASCSKDKRIERHMYRKDGNWTVTTADWQHTIIDSTGPHVTLGNTPNAGSFTFDKDGSGSFTLTVDNATFSGPFTWSVDNEKISIVKASQSVDIASGSVTQTAIAFSGTQDSKTKMTLSGTKTVQYAGSANVTEDVLSGTFTLEKK